MFSESEKASGDNTCHILSMYHVSNLEKPLNLLFKQKIRLPTTVFRENENRERERDVHYAKQLANMKRMAFRTRCQNLIAFH